MSILITADNHLQTGPRQPDSLFALDQIYEIAARYQVEAVLQGGDLTDQPHSTAPPIGALYRFLDQLAAAGIKYYGVRGNHEGQSDWATVHPHAVAIDRVTCHLEDLCVYGLDFRPRGPLQEELAKVPEGTDLLLLHQAMSPWMGEQTLPQGDLADIDNTDFVAIGDLHQCRCETIRNKTGRAVTVASPGATLACKINEPHEHFVLLFDKSKGFRKIKLRSRPYVPIGPLTAEEQVNDLVRSGLAELLDEAAEKARTDNIPGPVAQPYVHVTYNYALANVVQRIEKANDGRGLLVWKEIPPVCTPSAAKVAAIQTAAGGAVSPLALLPSRLSLQEQPTAYALAEAVLRTANVKEQEAAVEQWRSHMLGDTHGEDAAA